MKGIAGSMPWYRARVPRGHWHSWIIKTHFGITKGNLKVWTEWLPWSAPDVRVTLATKSARKWVSGQKTMGPRQRKTIAVKVIYRIIGLDYLESQVVWPWNWPNNIDNQTWPRYHQNVRPYQTWIFFVKSYSPNRNTDRHRQYENITLAAYTGGNNCK